MKILSNINKNSKKYIEFILQKVGRCQVDEADTEFGSWVGWVGRVGWVGPTQFSILEFFLNLICCCF